MSLFPAYNTNSSQSGDGERKIPEAVVNINADNAPSWLTNSSYPSESRDKQDEGEKEKQSETRSNDKVEKSKSSHKKKRKKEKKEKSSRYKRSVDSKYPSSTPKILESDSFYEDKKQERGNFLVDTLHRPAVPRYNKHTQFFKRYRYLLKKHKKGKKTKRYFSKILTTKDRKDEGISDVAEPSVQEVELTKVTEDFNKRLAEDPGNEQLWLEYVRFQDTMFEFEKAYRRNPIGGERVTSERKLAILERAMQSNPASERLLAERLSLLEVMQSVEQVTEECSRLLVQDPGSLPLWRTLVRVTRGSMARCTVPGVLQLYSKAVTRLGMLRALRLPLTVETDILKLVMEAGLFLQQAGLWEQLWTLLQMYLGTSLTASGQFDVPATLDEDRLQQQEDSVVASGLPLSVLWLRVEKLRAACHFLPDNNCETDPQRVVFTDDVAGLLQPVMSSELRLQLVAMVMVLLKVPLLPTRHSLLLCLGLLDIPYALNNIESVLAAVFPSSHSSTDQCRYLSGAAELITEPQYLRDELGQPQFLSWVVSVLSRCAELLPTAEAVTVHTWTLRLYRLLCRLHALRLADVPPVLKQARAHARQLLKLPQFRDSLLLYSEYALLERDGGDVEKACKVLETAVAMSGGQAGVGHTLLCRRLAECLLSTGRKEEAVRVLGSAPPSGLRWEQLCEDLALTHVPQAGQPLTILTAEAPHQLVESLACHALSLSLTHSVWEATAMLQRHIDRIPHNLNTLGGLWVEQLYEVLVDTLYTHAVQAKTSYTLLRDTLVKALSIFPNNLTLLHTLATIETGSGGGGSPLWKLVTFFPPTAPLARLVLVFVVRCRLASHNTGEVLSHYLRSLLGQLTREQTTAQCPLMWRLYLQLVAATDSSTQVKAAFYKCLHSCPWVKAFYLDAVQFLPEEMAEVQDLLIEKELRLHIAPEELEELRD